MTRKRVLLVGPEVVRRRMAGGGLRFWHMAEVLAPHHDVTLAVEEQSDLAPDGFDVVAASGRRLVDMAAGADVVVVQGYALHTFPDLVAIDVPVVVDLYNPFHIESFESYRSQAEATRLAVAGTARRAVEAQIERGDFFLCATERQRVFWLGHLALAGRLTPGEHDRDPQFRSLIAVAPSGVSSSPPDNGPPRLRPAHGIGAEATVLLWSGGLYDWLDPGTVVRAFAAAAPRLPETHLVFLGGSHPNTAAPPQMTPNTTRRLASDLGIDRVHFHDEWVPFQERGAVLAEADAGVSAHPDTLETALSFRTRLLDHLWVGLPTVTTEGDEVGDAIVAAGAGVSVPAGDVAGMADAMVAVMDDGARRQRMAGAAVSLGATMTWERQLEPLLRFCAQPRRASPTAMGGPSPGYLTRRLVDYARRGEWRRAANRTRATLRRMRNQG